MFAQNGSEFAFLLLGLALWKLTFSMDTVASIPISPKFLLVSYQSPLFPDFFFLLALQMPCSKCHKRVFYSLLVARIDIAFLFYLFIFYWSIADLQCCVNFYHTAGWFSHMYIYILFYILFHYGSSQDTGYSSLCYTVGPCCPFIPYIIVCIC